MAHLLLRTIASPGGVRCGGSKRGGGRGAKNPATCHRDQAGNPSGLREAGAAPHQAAQPGPGKPPCHTPEEPTHPPAEPDPLVLTSAGVPQGAQAPFHAARHLRAAGAPRAKGERARRLHTPASSHIKGKKETRPEPNPLVMSSAGVPQETQASFHAARRLRGDP